MKKLLITLLIICILGGGYFAYIKFFRTSERYNPLYAIPGNAAWIIETEDPFNSWDKFSTSDVWTYLKGNPLLADITHMVDSMDSEWRSNETIFKYIGSRPMLLSGHPVRNKIEYYFVVDLEEASGFVGFRNLLLPALEKYYKVNIRDYRGNEILELYDEEYHETIYLSIYRNLLLGSYRHTLVEAALDQIAVPVLGRDLDFIRVREELGFNGLFRLYIQWKYLLGNITDNLDDKTFFDELGSVLKFSGFDFEYDESKHIISMEGYTSTNDTIASIFNIFNRTGRVKPDIHNALSKRAAVFNELGFDSTEKLSAFLDEILLAEDPELIESRKKLESYLGINLDEDFFRWIDNEIALFKLWSEGKADQMGIVIKAKDSTLARQSLEHIGERIKKKTPVKFKTINYRGYEINFMSVKGFFKMILGSLAKDIERPYYTIIDKYVFFSNHPYTLRGLIDDYLAGETLSSDSKFTSYLTLFEEMNSGFLYANSEHIARESKRYLDKETFDKVMENSKYLYCFPMMALQITAEDGLYRSDMHIPFTNLKEASAWVNALKTLDNSIPDNMSLDSLSYDSVFNATETIAQTEELIIPEDIIPDDLDSKKYQEYYENGNVKFEVGIKNGLKHGTYIEYDEKGRIKVKGRYRDDQADGIWKQYDSLGNTLNRIRYRDGIEN